MAAPVRRRARCGADADVIVVGGGPAGAVAGWALARRGLRVTVLERERFPREKVCGDFIEPRGLRLFGEMGSLDSLGAATPLPITHVAIFVEARTSYRGPIPFYGRDPALPPHGFIVPRRELDHQLLNAARRAGAEIREGCAVSCVTRDGRAMRVTVRSGRRDAALRALLVIGADGTHSVVARSAGLRNHDPRYTAVSQRAYADGIRTARGEAAFFFDGDLFPGYGWMFPMTEGRANIGVGILSETRARFGISVPRLFDTFIERLRRVHPACSDLRVVSKPLGGIVRTYGGAGPNHFDGGLLVGDAGSFVDPITGEGITPAAESSLIAADVAVEAVAEGRVDADFLSRYERRFRAYFDPAMQYLDLCAAVMRNVHMRDVWLAAAARGCEAAASDAEFARVAGAGFGGLDVRPLEILSRFWLKVAELGGAAWVPLAAQWNAGWWRSILADPAWHAGWAADVLAKWTRVAATLSSAADPRLAGPVPMPQAAPRRRHATPG